MSFLMDLSEDEYDIVIVNEAYAEYVENGKERHPIEELREDENL